MKLRTGTEIAIAIDNLRSEVLMQNGNGRKTVTISLQPRHYDFVKIVAAQAGLGISETIRELIEHCSDLRPIWHGPLLVWQEPAFRRKEQGQ